MQRVEVLLGQALDRLDAKPGFSPRPAQRQLAFLIADLILAGTSGAFEAPTGLGKSLAILLPALICAALENKRTVIATYTNVLAEQYWNSDLPLALEILDGLLPKPPEARLLIGRQRYACRSAMNEANPYEMQEFRNRAVLGLESEFRATICKPAKEVNTLWSKISTPPVCPARLCPQYHECYYYRARKFAETSGVVITNHSVVIQDGIMSRASEDESSLLGDVDFLIFDEAHDLPQAATNGLEFEISGSKLDAMVGLAGRIHATMLNLAERLGEGPRWSKAYDDFKKELAACETQLAGLNLFPSEVGILTASPEGVLDHPHVKNSLPNVGDESVRILAARICDACDGFVKLLEDNCKIWRDREPEQTKSLYDTVKNYASVVREFGFGCHRLFSPEGVSVSYFSKGFSGPMLRQDVIDLADPLREILWDRVPAACVSATLAVDNRFDHFNRVTGFTPAFEEILPSPFEPSIRSAVYLPQAGKVPDPTIARREGTETYYFEALAQQLSEIIALMGGRTLALFHSRREMEAVAAKMKLPPGLPLVLQTKFGVASVGERFKLHPETSLFALRSFWTGFDAPGDTLSCVALVRIPFEVPIDPPQIARLAYLQTQERDAFREHTLPNAKMLMRQGAGRLLRRVEDFGVIAILDPRVRSKPYGEEFISNLPDGTRTYDDFRDAMAYVGLEAAQ